MYITSRSSKMPGSNLVHGNGTFRANLNAGLATETLVLVNRIGLAVYQLQHPGWTGVNAFLITRALVLVDFHLPSHDTSSILREY
jgi:hypothetical protein